MVSQKTRALILCAVFIALSVVGASIKVPSPTGTVAFDSAPGFIAALLLGPSYGALTAALGHIFTSWNTGFPLTLPVHLVIAAEMAFFAFVFAALGKRNLPLAAIVTSALNGIVAPASMMLFGFGVAFFLSMVLPLTVASALNALAATFIYSAVKRAGVMDHADKK